jgi:hypothetical protein
MPYVYERGDDRAYILGTRPNTVRSNNCSSIHMLSAVREDHMPWQSGSGTRPFPCSLGYESIGPLLVVSERAAASSRAGCA